MLGKDLEDFLAVFSSFSFPNPFYPTERCSARGLQLDHFGKVPIGRNQVGGDPLHFGSRGSPLPQGVKSLPFNLVQFEPGFEATARPSPFIIRLGAVSQHHREVRSALVNKKVLRKLNDFLIGNELLKQFITETTGVFRETKGEDLQLQISELLFQRETLDLLDRLWSSR